MPFVSIVIPVLNERGAAVRLLDQAAHLEAPWSFEVLFVDGGSRDGTFELVARSENTVIRPPLRQTGIGLASAWREGIAATGGMVVVTMDGDGVHPMASVLDLVARMQGSEDLVIARRYGPGGSGMPGRRLADRWASRAAAWAWRARFGLDIHDPLHGFRARSRRLVESVHPRIRHTEGNVWMACEALAAARAGLEVVEVPVPYGRRSSGKDQKKLVREGLRFCRRLVTDPPREMVR